MTETLPRSPRPQQFAAPPETAVSVRCPFCLEEINPGASVCPHCGGVLVPFQRLSDDQTALEVRLAALEQEIAALRPTLQGTPAEVVPTTATTQTVSQIFGWPHMADNLFLGLVTLLATHWLVTTLPLADRGAYRLAALAVALPFGFRFEAYARSTASGQVLAALAFGGLGTLVVGMLDVALAGGMPPNIDVQYIAASVAAIALSHLAGSFLARARRPRAERKAAEAAAAQAADAPLDFTASVAAIRQVKPDTITSRATAVKAFTDAAAALAAAVAALWAAFGHILS